MKGLDGWGVFRMLGRGKFSEGGMRGYLDKGLIFENNCICYVHSEFRRRRKKNNQKMSINE